VALFFGVTDPWPTTYLWTEFDGPGFKTILPIYPNHTTQKIQTPNPQVTVQVDSYESDQEDGNKYIVSVAAYSPKVDVGLPSVMLENELNNLLVAANSKLLSEQKSTYNAYPALDFSMHSENSYAKGRYVLVDHTLYEILYSYGPQTYKEGDFSKFLSSFTLNASRS
jgi:hypothetical protein